VDPDWVRSMYSFAIKPDAALFFRVPLQVAIGRIMAARAELKYYEAGMDVGLSDNIVESFKLFQGKILDEYNKMVDEFDLTVIDGTQSDKAQQKIVRGIVKNVLKGWHGLPNPDKKDISVQNMNTMKHEDGKGKGGKK
jgi:dTMP kinase